MSAHAKGAVFGASENQGAPKAANNDLSWEDVQGSPSKADVCEAEIIDDDSDLESAASNNGEHPAGVASANNGEHPAGAVDVNNGEHHGGFEGAQSSQSEGGVRQNDEATLEQDDDEQASKADEGMDNVENISSKLLEAAQAQAADMKDKYARLQAEWDNFRKRMNAQRDSERMLAAEKLVTDLLPILDDLERAISHAKDSGEGGSLTDGVEAVQTKLLQILAKHNVSQIDALGQPFDATRHQAVGTKEDISVPEESVVEVYQQGYEMADKVIRPAMVVTSTGGPAQASDGSAQTGGAAQTGGSAQAGDVQAGSAAQTGGTQAGDAS